MSKSLISPLIWWLIIVFSFTSFASAAIAITYDVVGTGKADLESEFYLGRTRITSDGGEMAASQRIVANTDTYNSTTLANLDRGSIRIKSANTDTRAKAKNLLADVKLNYNFERVAGVPEIIEDEEGNAFIQIIDQRKHFEDVSVNVSGDAGRFDQEAVLNILGKKRKVFDASMDGNFSVNQVMHFSGLELIETVESLPDEEKIDESEAEEILRSVYSEVMKLE